VVPTHNRREVLVSRTLPALFRQNLAASEYEIIVVVDGSTDGTAQAVRGLRSSAPVKVLEQPNRGPSAARNKGIEASKGDLVLFVDDDIVCSPSLLKQHLEAHAGQGDVVVYGPISIAPETPPSLLRYTIEEWYQDYYRHIESQGGLRWPQDDYLISNSSIPRSRLAECGGFDEDMPAKEDYELGLRLWKAGIKFTYLPHARAYEYYRKPSGRVLHRDGEGFGRSEVLLSRKHPEYRPYSTLAALGKSHGWRRWWRNFYVGLPAAPVSLLAPAIWTCDKLCRFPVMRRAGHYLLGVGRGIVEVRAAVKEAGSWAVLQREFGAHVP